MNFEKLDQLIAIPKKSDASKATRKEYKAEISKLLEEEGFSVNAEKYLWSGFSFCGAEPLFDFINFQAKENQPVLVEKLLKCRTYIKNEKSNGFKMCLSLLAYELNYCPDNAEIIGMLIKGCVATYKKKDGSIFKDNVKTIEKYFVLVLTPQSKLPDWSTISIKPAIINEFCNYIVGACSTITGNKATEKVKKAVTWLKSALSPASDDLPQNKPVEVSVTITEKKEEPANDLVQTKSLGSLFGVSAQLRDISTQLYAFAEESKKAEKTTALLMSDNKALASKLGIAEDTISKLQNQLTESEANLATQRAQVSELSSEIEKLKTVISVYSEDKQSSMDGQLNAIASKLKTEYREFKDALDLEMTVEIGEILRDQLMRVFNILSKAGIDIESR